jgi:predicted dehydrogenase
MKVLMVGLGGIGQRHVRNLRALLGSEVEILAYRSRKLPQVVTERLEIEAGATVEEKYNIQAYTDLDSALGRKPDVVFVCNPSSLHMPVACAAAEAGCHLFIEKPLSHTSDRVDELIKIVDTKRLVSLVGYQLRFHPCLQRLRDLLQQGAIGRVLAVRAEVGEYLPGWHRYEDYRQMYASRSQLGGGVILSQIHELDYLYWLFGLPRRVFALGGHLSSLEVDVEDVASILLECTIDGQAIPVQVHMDYVQRPPSRTCKVIGDNGKISVDFHALTLQYFDRDGGLAETTSFDGFQRNQLFLDEMKHFMACLQGQQSPLVTVRGGAQSLQVALAAKQSLQTGNVVELSSVGNEIV